MAHHPEHVEEIEQLKKRLTAAQLRSKRVLAEASALDILLDEALHAYKKSDEALSDASRPRKD